MSTRLLQALAFSGPVVGAHLSPAEILQYVNEQTPDSEMERVDEHLSTCRECAAAENLESRRVECTRWSGENGEMVTTRSTEPPHNAPGRGVDGLIDDIMRNAG